MEEVTLMRKCGRDLGRYQLQNAVRDGSRTQITNQLEMLNWSACHVLATTIYNDIRQNKRHRMHAQNDIEDMIRSELEFIIKNEGALEFRKIESEIKL